MTDSTTPPVATGDELPASLSQAVEPPPSSSSGWSTSTLRWGRRGLALLVAVVAAFVVSVFTVDLATLWPGMRPLAERFASKFLKRPMHIGGISAMLTPGDFVLDDVRIEGLTPDARPFFAARRIYVHVPWWTMFRLKLDIEVDITDWTMAVETWEGGRHSLPNLKFGDGSPRKESWYTTTVRFAYAKRGQFYYHDHATPWSVEVPNLEFGLVRAYSLNQYVGLASFSKGVTRIQQSLPMATDMSTRFVLNGGVVHLEHLDLTTDGSVSRITGDVDFRNWPDQTYHVESDVDFARMKEIFFAKETWRVGGEGQFTGVFRYPKDGRRELTGEFRSGVASIRTSAESLKPLELVDLQGALIWKRELFAVTRAEADVLGGDTRFTYSLAPLGTKTGATASFEADYRQVDLFALDRLVTLPGLRLRGSADGRVSMSWPNGKLSTGLTGEGHTAVRPFGDVALATAELPPVPRPIVPEPLPFDGAPRTSTLAFGADLRYRFDESGITFDKSIAATPYTHVAFEGQLASRGDSTFPFRVTSADWQESDRLLSAIMTAVGHPAGAVEVGGRGTFDGVMTGRFSSPRIAGHFDGEAVRAWGVTWGRAVADVLIEGGYVTLSKSRIGDHDDRSVVPTGRFSLGFRKDDRDEIDAKVTFANWSVSDLKAAFKHAGMLDDWSMDGTVGSADLSFKGQYRNLFGGGPVRIVNGVAWGETFRTATANIDLEGTGMSIRSLEIQKGETGTVRGYANVVWDGTYGFHVDGVGIPIDTLDTFRSSQLPLTGSLGFTALGAGSFRAPAYSVDGSIQDLFIGDEGVGPVSGRLSVANDVMTLERVFVTSPRFVALLGSGTIALDDTWTSNLSLRFQGASLAPFLKFVLPEDVSRRVSPYTRLEASGSMAVNGPLADRLALRGSVTVEEAELTLFDYPVSNDGPIQLTLDRGALSIGSFRVKGVNTNLSVTGGADARASTYDLHATGNASLAILQLFFRNLTASGAATLNASLTGPVATAQLTGQASIANGRLRPLDSPHGLEAINGSLIFGSDGIRLCEPSILAPCEPLTGRLGAGEVRFGGSISLDGLVPKELNLTALGRSMRLRYPAGFTSTVDMDLFMTGPVDSPHLSGDVDVLRLSYTGSVNAEAGLLALSAPGGASAPSLPRPGRTPPIRMTLDIRVSAPHTSLVDTRTARIDGQADLRVRGTFDQPQIDGQVDILGGEYQFNGNRIFVRDSSTIDFRQGDRLEPVFDILAETRVRVTGQTFTVTIGLRGTFDGLNVSLTSEPYLPEADIVTLLFGGTPDWGSPEQRALGSSQELQQRMFQTAGAVLLTSALTSRVGDVFERTGAFDTVQITPLLNDAAAFQKLDPGARVTLGKRISPRVFLTYSRTFNTGQEELILLEYDQSDRMSWVLSRNGEDGTYALDFRIRYVF